MIRLDPRIETSGLWPDFHVSFINSLRDWLLRRLGRGYLALIEERVYIAWEGASLPSLYRPDVAVARVDTGEVAAQAPSSTAAATPPLIVPVALLDEVREYTVSIKTAAGRLVTAIEVLSPNNKRMGHEGRQAYLAKRLDMFAAGVHLVEIDLLREGERLPLAQPWPPCDRAVLVVRKARLHAGELYTFSATDPLPAVSVPLLSPDPDVVLDLQAVLEEMWVRTDYDRIIAQLPKT